MSGTHAESMRAPMGHGAFARSHVRMIVADDENALRRALTQLLTEAGYDVVATASDGVEAVAMAEQLLPNVVILDLRMPGMTGIEAATVLRERLPNMHIIILSAYDDAGLQVVAERIPISAYLVK